MQFPLQLELDVRAAGSSSYTRELIEKRLALLAQRTDAEAQRERQYLLELKSRTPK
jgi:hypothetical protein